MKKMFFYAAVAAVAFASCSKDNGVEVPTINEENEGLQPIEFRMSTNMEVTTRGGGAVGDATEAENKWNKQLLNVYMFDSCSMNLAKTAEGEFYFVNDTIKAPAGVSTGPAHIGTAAEPVVKYYGPNKEDVYDFFAYHADDATKGATPANVGDTVYTVSVTIDGTQDLMVAKAWLNKEDSATYKTNGAFTSDEAFATACKRVYSSYSARRGVQPRFAFKHLLSRFVFSAEAANDDALEIMIDSVKITEAYTTAKMTIAALNEENLGLSEWKDPAILALKTRNEDTLKIDTLKEVNKKVKLGESLLLAPKAEGTKAAPATYELEVYYSQMKGEKKLTDKYTALIEAPEKTGYQFKKGYQYAVNIKIYGFQMIELICDLTRWEDGGNIDIDSEE